MLLNFQHAICIQRNYTTHSIYSRRETLPFQLWLGSNFHHSSWEFSPYLFSCNSCSSLAGHKSWENCMQTLVCQLLWIVTPCSVEQGLYGCGILHVGSPRFIFCPCITMPWSKLTDYLHVSCVFTLEKYLLVVMCSEILCCLVQIYWDPMRR